LLGTDTGNVGIDILDPRNDKELEVVAYQSIPVTKNGLISVSFNGSSLIASAIVNDMNGAIVAPILSRPVSGYDLQPPVTTPDVAGTSGQNDWYTSDVTVSFTADDGNGMGVKATTYSLDNGPWQTYDSASPIVIMTEGAHTLQYYSTDFFGNKETTKTFNFSIDATPIANAGSNQTVRFGSNVTLNGSASTDPDNGPLPLSFFWTQTAGNNVNLSGSDTANPKFTPTVKGLFTFGLVVNDGLDNSTSASVNITVPTLGDIDLDGDVDSNDLSRITSTLNKPANGPNDLRDINGDMKLDALDTRKLVLLCTRPRCATQ
jgi:hypothetical protein